MSIDWSKPLECDAGEAVGIDLALALRDYRRVRVQGVTYEVHFQTGEPKAEFLQGPHLRIRNVHRTIAEQCAHAVRDVDLSALMYGEIKNRIITVLHDAGLLKEDDQ